MGVADEYVTSYSHDKLPVFGKGKEISQENWESILRQTVLYDYLEKDIDNFGILKLSKKGLDFLERPTSVIFSKDHDYINVEEEGHHEIETVQAKSYDAVLYDMLKSLRKKVAKQRGLPPYVIFQDPSLEEMSTIYPTNLEELAQVNGVGMAKAKKFGKKFIELIEKYVEENDITTASDVVVKSTINKSKTKIFIIQQIDRKVNLDEIIESKGITMAELIDEIEHICYSGTKLNIDYYLSQYIDEERQQEIFDYFMEAESDDISTALKELGDDEFTEEELRLMRIKFLSEVAL
jgi:ATP-dependent DNA helicase RecQ